MWETSCPVGESVSIASFRLFRPTPSLRNASAHAIKSLSDRPAGPGARPRACRPRRCESACYRFGHSAVPPAMSSKIRSHPASFSTSRYRSSVWSSVKHARVPNQHRSVSGNSWCLRLTIPMVSGRYFRTLDVLVLPCYARRFVTRRYAEACCRIACYLQAIANRGRNSLVAIQIFRAVQAAEMLGAESQSISIASIEMKPEILS